MKVMKLALLGTAALAAASLSARADDLSDLKAQIEALNSRIATLESAPAVPAGYKLMTVSEAPAIVVPGLEEIDPSYGATATNIGVLPTADVPASTNVQWSGFVRAALVYTNDDITAGANNDSDSDLDVAARTELKVVGTTDTAVGEVGVMVKLRANWTDFDSRWNNSSVTGAHGGESGGAFSSPEAWGWWKMTPELTFAGGFAGSLGNIGYGYDGACNCYYTDNADAAFNPGDVTQMRLTYASGPLSAAIALEDGDNHDGLFGSSDADGVGPSDSLGVAGEVKYSGDMFSAEVSGVWRGQPDSVSNASSDMWQVGIGADVSLGDMFKVSAAGAIGQNYQSNDRVGGSVLLSANLSDALSAEVGYAHVEYDGFGPSAGYEAESDSILAGIYYTPVSQLTLGVEGEWYDWEDNDGFRNKSTSVDFVTVFRF